MNLYVLMEVQIEKLIIIFIISLLIRLVVSWKFNFNNNNNNNKTKKEIDKVNKIRKEIYIYSSFKINWICVYFSLIVYVLNYYFED